MARHLTNDMQAILEPRELAAGCGRKDGDLAIFTLKTVLRYVFAVVSEMSCSVVW